MTRWKNRLRNPSLGQQSEQRNETTFGQLGRNPSQFKLCRRDDIKDIPSSKGGLIKYNTYNDYRGSCWNELVLSLARSIL